MGGSELQAPGGGGWGRQGRPMVRSSRSGLWAADTSKQSHRGRRRRTGQGPRACRGDEGGAAVTQGGGGWGKSLPSVPLPLTDLPERQADLSGGGHAGLPERVCIMASLPGCDPVFVEKAPPCTDPVQTWRGSLSP